MSRLAPFDGALTAEGEHVGTAGAGALSGEVWGAVVFRSWADVAATVTNLGLGAGEACRGEASEEECVEVELHVGSVLVGACS